MDEKELVISALTAVERKDRKELQKGVLDFLELEASSPGILNRILTAADLNQDSLEKEIISKARALCLKFVDKVESGRAKNKETYADCKNLLAGIDEYHKRIIH